ncbi:MAG: hypothetical protein HZB24_14905, partial [Desulfobacterales bacterium]|nr:hypothetical protein [Desulfobacterales bacterium]
PSHMVYPDGYEVSYEYHLGCGLLHKVTGLGSDGVVKELATYTNYPVTGKIGTILFGNNVQTQYDYDALSGRLTDLLTMDATNAKIVDRSYAYTPAGDIRPLTDASNPANVVTRAYAYDRLHRLRRQRQHAQRPGHEHPRHSGHPGHHLQQRQHARDDHPFGPWHYQLHL